MSVHYKFKSALDFDTITFDGLHISVADLKKAIIHQKRLGKTTDFDLQITNAQTKEEYVDDSTLIPKNTSLIIARIPLAVQQKKIWDPQNEKTQSIRNVPEPDSGTLDLSQMNGSEEDKIQAMMIQSTMDYDPNNYQKLRGQGQVGEVPANYRCFKCHKPGHWIKNCPLNVSSEMMDVKRNTGIPRSFIDRDQQENTEPQIQAPPPKVQEIPEDLICNICKDLFTDAAMIPCCGSSFCDECVRTALLESEDNECPDCKEKGCSPGSLIPNRFLRNSVNAFKNETGYNKPRPRRDPPKAKEVTPNTQQTNNAVQNNQPVRNNNATTTPNETVNSGSAEETKEDNEKDSSTKQEEKIKKDIPEAEKKTDMPAAHLSHDETESDFEDNITVTVPPAHMQTQRSSYRERHYNEKAPWSSKTMMHMSPMGGNPMSRSTSSPADRSMSPMMDANKDIPDQQQQQKHHHGSSMHLSQRGDMPIRSHRTAPEQMYNAGPPPPVSTYGPTQPMMGPSRPYDHMSGYNVPHGHNYNPYMMGERVRGPYHPPRPGYPPVHHMRPRHVAPSNALASVYQGVAAKVGPGIIDDPLEAFNRIMREKEKRKEERRRSPERRRSRSVEQNFGRRPSPGPYNRFRNRSPEEWRQRSPPRERRGRSRERDRRSVEKDKRRQRSSSFSDRSSRSRSWSIPPRRRTKSPQLGRRRSRSRSPSFNVNRFRPKEPPRGRMERKDEFPREDFRDNRSPPYHYQGRRPRSRGRLLSPPPQFRQDRNNYNQDQYYNHPGPSYDEGGGGGGGSGSYPHNRYPRGGGSPSKAADMQSNRRGRNSGIAGDRNDYHNERYDDAILPPGSDEPPPPGYENSPPSQYERRNSKNYNQFGDDHGMYMKDNYRKPDNFNDKNIMSPSKSSQRDLPPTDYEMRRFDNTVREREVRSWSRDSRRSTGFNTGAFEKKRKTHSRSRSPLWTAEKYPDHHTRDRNPSRERYRHSVERQHHSSGTEFERKKDKLEKDKKPSDKRETTDRKSHEKENRFVNKEDKDHDRQSRQSDKERKRDSSDDEKKDKKSKEKRKKKKEDKKKNKRDKKDKDKDKDKEKEKKEKDKNKEKQEIVNINEFSIEKNIAPDNEESESTNVLKADTDTPHPEPGCDVGNSNSVRERNEDGETSPTDKGKKEKKPGSEDVDLYGDICPEEDVKYDVPENTEETGTYSDKLSPTERTTPTNIQRFDSFLDIHDYEPDLEEMVREGVTDNNARKDQNVTVPMPELSKWERDDENQQGDERREIEGSNLSEEKLTSSGKVTIDVIKRAENAIFQRAINAIRPIEIKKISADRQKLYANEPSPSNKSVTSSPPGIMAKDHPQSPPQEVPSFQITVATTNNSSERSVEATRDIHHQQQQEHPQHELKKSPVRSVKDRLGSKVSEPSRDEVKISASRKSSSSIVGVVGEWNREKPRRSRSRDRHRETGADHREPRRGSEIKRPHEPFRQRDRNNSPRDRRFVNENIGKFRDQNRGRREDFLNKDKGWMRDRENRDRDRPRDGGNMKIIDRSGRDNKFAGRLTERDFVRGRDRGFNQPNRFKESIQPQYGFNKDDKTREINKKDKEKNKYRSEKRERTRSMSSDRRVTEKRPRLLDKDNREKTTDEKYKSTDTAKTDKDDHRKKSNNQEQQEHHRKPIIDEQNFIPDYDETTGHHHQGNYHQQQEDTNMKKLEENTRHNNKDNQEKTKDLKSKLTEPKKRSSSKSADSSSSSSSSSTDSESEGKRKKRRKHKKEKKKSRRASSGDSSGSVKHKRSKSKKKSKSSKKKKKSKK